MRPSPCPSLDLPVARCSRFDRARILVAAVLVSGCASLPVPPLRPGGVTAIPAGLANDRLPPAALRAGDRLIVSVTSGGESRERGAQVDARGELHVASGRDVQVGGLELEQAERRVNEAVRSTEKHAEVSLRMEAASRERISVLGALARPGYLTLRNGMRLVDMVAEAGGVLTVQAVADSPPIAVADMDRSVLVRDGRALPISFREALRGAPGHNVYIHPGDLLYVPLATDRSVSVFGQVAGPRALPHRAGMRLTEALSMAGGITSGGDKTDIRLVRGPAEAPKVYRSSLSAIVDGTQRDVVLAPGDVLFVQDDPAEDAGEVLRLLGPLASLGILVFTAWLITSSGI